MKKIIIAVLACTMVSLISCDKIKDATSIDFKVKGVKFDFSGVVSELAPLQVPELRAGATQTFAVTRTVNISEIGDSDAVSYANKISKVVVNSSLVKVTFVPAGSYTIENLVITADGVAGSPLSVPTISTGGTFTFTSAMNNFTAAFVTKLLSTKTITVTVRGETDAPVGTTINISYESDLLLTASLL